MTLELCVELDAARWIVERALPWTEVAGPGPGGFAKYARIRFIPDPVTPGRHSNGEIFPDRGISEHEQIGIALEILAGCTSTPDLCFFCIWDGWGSATSIPEEYPKLVMPDREYWVVCGSIEDHANWNSPDIKEWNYGTAPDPSFIWPADKSWCVSKDVDDHYAVIGSAASAIELICSDERLDAVEIRPGQELPYWD